VIEMSDCEKCGSDKIEVDMMWRVTGQTGMAPEALIVKTCRECGHKWNE